MQEKYERMMMTERKTKVKRKKKCYSLLFHYLSLFSNILAISRQTQWHKSKEKRKPVYNRLHLSFLLRQADQLARTVSPPRGACHQLLIAWGPVFLYCLSHVRIQIHHASINETWTRARQPLIVAEKGRGTGVTWYSGQYLGLYVVVIITSVIHTAVNMVSRVVYEFWKWYGL